MLSVRTEPVEVPAQRPTPRHPCPTHARHSCPPPSSFLRRQESRGQGASVRPEGNRRGNGRVLGNPTNNHRRSPTAPRRGDSRRPVTLQRHNHPDTAPLPPRPAHRYLFPMDNNRQGLGQGLANTLLTVWVLVCMARIEESVGFGPQQLGSASAGHKKFSICSCNATRQLQIRIPLEHSSATPHRDANRRFPCLKVQDVALVVNVQRSRRPRQTGHRDDVPRDGVDEPRAH